MYVNRKLSEINDVPLIKWDLKELAYYHEQMSQMADFLNEQGVSMHNKIIKEIEHRGGLHKDFESWEHSSDIIFD